LERKVDALPSVDYQIYVICDRSVETLSFDCDLIIADAGITKDEVAARVCGGRNHAPGSDVAQRNTRTRYRAAIGVPDRAQNCRRFGLRRNGKWYKRR
jgi:hypothetical protein